MTYYAIYAHKHLFLPYIFNEGESVITNSLLDTATYNYKTFLSQFQDKITTNYSPSLPGLRDTIKKTFALYNAKKIDSYDNLYTIPLI